MVKFQAEWEDFRDKVIPESASAVQVSETKKAFYAGALALISLTSTMFSEEREVTEKDINDYDSLVNEIVSVCKMSFISGRDYEMN